MTPSKTPEMLAEIKTDIVLLKTSTARLVAYVEGDGKPGLIERMTSLEHSVSLISKADQDDRNNAKEANKRKIDVSDKFWVGVALIIASQIIAVFVVTMFR